MPERKLVVAFNLAEMCEILRILMDEDKEAAYEFIKKRLKNKIDELEYAH